MFEGAKSAILIISCYTQSVIAITRLNCLASWKEETKAYKPIAADHCWIYASV